MKHVSYICYQSKERNCLSKTTHSIKLWLLYIYLVGRKERQRLRGPPPRSFYLLIDQIVSLSCKLKSFSTHSSIFTWGNETTSIYLSNLSYLSIISLSLSLYLSNFLLLKSFPLPVPELILLTPMLVSWFWQYHLVWKVL